MDDSQGDFEEEANGLKSEEGAKGSHGRKLSMSKIKQKGRLVRENTWSCRLLRQKRNVYRLLLQEPWHYPILAMNIAAVVIQKIARGFLVRRRNKRKRRTERKKKKRALASRNLLRKYSIANKILSTKLESSNESLTGTNKVVGYGLTEFCATKIQSWFRMIQEKYFYRLQRFQIYQLAALQLQYCWRQSVQRKYEIMYIKEKPKMVPASTEDIFDEDSFPKMNSIHAPSMTLEKFMVSPRQPSTCSSSNASYHDSLLKAHNMVLQSWRRYTNTRIFAFLKNLIKFKLSGDPSNYMKILCNPEEADLLTLDKSMNAHIKFRLAGFTFPPTVVYKIYTSSPICDVNSFAPRDYSFDREVLKNTDDLYPAREIVRENAVERYMAKRTKMQNRKENKKSFLHTSVRVGKSYFPAIIKQYKTITEETLDSWYERYEANGWRPVGWNNVYLEEEKQKEEAMHEENLILYSQGKIKNVLSSENLNFQQYYRFNNPKCHHNHPINILRLKRKQDIILQRKFRKRQWLISLYKDGKLKEEMEMINDVKEGQEKNKNIFDESQLETLRPSLEWNSDLEYDNYIKNWQMVGTSVTSGKYQNQEFTAVPY